MGETETEEGGEEMEGESGRQRQRRTNVERAVEHRKGGGEGNEGNTMGETQRGGGGGGRDGGRDEGCCILVIAQTEAAGADRGMERINER